MNQLLTKTSVKLQAKTWQVGTWFRRQLIKVNNNRGAQSIEWLALAALVVGILMVILTNKSTIGKAIYDKINAAISGIDISGG